MRRHTLMSPRASDVMEDSEVLAEVGGESTPPSVRVDKKRWRKHPEKRMQPVGLGLGSQVRPITPTSSLRLVQISKTCISQSRAWTRREMRTQFRRWFLQQYDRLCQGAINCPTRSLPPPSSQSSAHSESTTLCRLGLAPPSGSPSLTGIPFPTLPGAITRSHLSVPSSLNPTRSAVRRDASFSACANHCTRRNPNPLAGAGAALLALALADTESESESESEGSSRQYRRSSATAFDATCVRWNAGNTITQPISALRFAGDALISAITPAITIAVAVVGWALAFEGWCTCTASSSGRNGGMPALLLLLPPPRPPVGLAWWLAMMAKRIAPGSRRRRISIVARSPSLVAISNGSQRCSAGCASTCFQSSSAWMDGLKGVNIIRADLRVFSCRGNAQLISYGSGP